MPEPIPDLSRDQQCHHYQAPTGQRCGSPALKGEYYCYHHHIKHAARNNRRVLIDPEVTCMEIPSIEDRASIFIALAAVVHRLAENTIDTRRAGQMIYGLQVAMQALEPAPAHRSSVSQPQSAAAHSNKSCHPERAQRAEEPVLSLSKEPRGTAPAKTADTTPPPDPPALTHIPISKEGLLYFLRSRHCASCNAELFPASELTERPNPGAPPAIIEESRPALPPPEAVILSEAPSLGEGAQSKDPEFLHPATADHTFQPQPQSQCSLAEASETAPTHSATGTIPSLHAVAENRRPTVMGEPPPQSTFPTGGPLPLSAVLLDNEKGCAWPDRTSFRKKIQDGQQGPQALCRGVSGGWAYKSSLRKQAACQPRWLATIGE